MPEWVTPVAIVVGLLVLGAAAAYWPMSLKVQAAEKDLAAAEQMNKETNDYLNAYQSNQDAAVFLERDVSDALSGDGSAPDRLERLLRARQALHRRLEEPLP